jgi:hypothetical protein
MNYQEIIMVDDILGNYQHWFMDSLTHIPHFNV